VASIIAPSGRDCSKRNHVKISPDVPTGQGTAECGSERATLKLAPLLDAAPKLHAIIAMWKPDAAQCGAAMTCQRKAVLVRGIAAPSRCRQATKGACAAMSAGTNRSVARIPPDKKSLKFQSIGKRATRGPGPFRQARDHGAQRRCKESWHLQRFRGERQRLAGISPRRMRGSFQLRQGQHTVSQRGFAPFAVDQRCQRIAAVRDKQKVLIFLDHAEDFKCTRRKHFDWRLRSRRAQRSDGVVTSTVHR